MLVLSRRTRESIRIDNEIEITVLGVRGRRVRLGIEAPPHVCVLRTEISSNVDDERFSLQFS